MPLQIRRGLESERTGSGASTIFALGELIYITDTNKLYVGDGHTDGGVQVTGFDSTDAIDSVAGALVGGVNNNISFTYGPTQQLAGRIDATVSLDTLLGDLDLNNYNINGTGTIDITGTVTATSFNGTVKDATGTTTLVNGTTSSINLNGTVKGNIIPDADITYDIGADGARFRDIWLSGSTIHLGNAHITASGTAVDLPIGSTIGGNNLISANAEGILLSDINGSLFADNSTMIIDGTDGTIHTNQLIADSGTLAIGKSSSPTSVSVKTDAALFIDFTGVSDGSNEPVMEFKVSAGTLGTPTTLSPGDSVTGFNIKSYDGTEFKSTAAIVNILAADAVMSDTNPKSDIYIAASAGGASFAEYILGGNGVLSAPVMKVGSYDTGNEPTVAEQGWIIFNNSTKKFLGFNGTTWVELG